MTTEARIGRAKAPRCLPLHRLRRWRWDVVRYRAVDGEHPGVLDRRVHLDSDHGYTFTRLGAAWAMAGAVMAAEADAEFDAWIDQANADITAALDEVVDTEGDLRRVKAAAHPARLAEGTNP